LQLLYEEELTIQDFMDEGKAPHLVWDKLGNDHEIDFARVTRSDKTTMQKIDTDHKRALEMNEEYDKKKKAQLEANEPPSLWKSAKAKLAVVGKFVEKSKFGKFVDKTKALAGREWDDLFDGDARYLALAKVNYDHFMPNSKLVYRAGHNLAINNVIKAHALVKKGGAVEEAREALVRAFALEGMANHFLTDMFAPGHLRTPRVALHHYCHATVGAFISKCSHDQDNKMGMTVENSLGQKWFAMGDSMYFDKENKKNRAMAKATVATSLREILYAFVHGKKDKNTFHALKMAPNPEMSEPLNPARPAMFKVSKDSKEVLATGSESDIDHILARRQQTKEGKDCNVGDEGCTEFSYKPIGTGSNGEVPGHSVKLICDLEFEFQLCSI